jgi:uncharacterized protein YhaN
MFLVELVLQGVRGIRELARLRFQSGFNFVAAGNEAGKTTTIDAMQRLLFPSSNAGHMDLLISKHVPDASRAALVVCSDDGTYYRIIQDFSKRAVNLSRYNAANKEFSLLHKDWDSAVRFMAGLTTEDVSEEDFSKVFVFRRDHYHDRPGAAAPASGGMAPPEAAHAAPSLAKAASRERLAELREALRKAEEAADAEYKAQAAKLATDDLKKKLAILEESDLKKGELESTLAELKDCATLPENLPELLDDYERIQGQKATEADELSKELEGVRMSIEEAPAANFMTDKLVIAGAVVGVLSFAAAFMITLQQEVFLGGLLLALALIAVGWYKSSQKNAQRNALMKETETIEKELADIEKRFAQQGAAVNACLQSTRSSTPAELKDKAENYRYFTSLLEDMQEQRQRVLGNLTAEALRQECAARQQETQELETAAHALAQYNVDTYSIRKDIEQLESESKNEGAWDLGAELHELQADFTAPAAPAAPSGSGGFQEDIAIASRVGGIEMETLVPAVEAAAQRNLAAITNGKYVRIEVGHDGGPPIVHAKDDSVIPYAELSHGTRDIVYFCLRTGLIEAITGKRRLPFILDDPLAGFDPERQKAAVQILRTLGTKTQVIILTSNPALKAAGDAAAELK